ncbi:MAG: VOC family protein [Saprospiraceae bacterium]
MRNKEQTKDFYLNKLGFSLWGDADYPGYLMIQKDAVQLHFFESNALNPLENDGQVYIRTNDIESLFTEYAQQGIIHPNGSLSVKPWGQKEFSVLDPDNNLLTFGQPVV